MVDASDFLATMELERFTGLSSGLSGLTNKRTVTQRIMQCLN